MDGHQVATGESGREQRPYERAREQAATLEKMLGAAAWAKLHGRDEVTVNDMLNESARFIAHLSGTDKAALIAYFVSERVSQVPMGGGGDHGDVEASA